MEKHEAAKRPLTLLIVDDSATMRAMMKRAALLSGVPVATVLEAANGREALDLLARQPVDAVFTDLNMPVMSGLELLKGMAGDPRLDHVLRVIVSTDGSDVRRRQVGDLHVGRYLQKPVRPEAVCDVLSELVSAG